MKFLSFLTQRLRFCSTNVVKVQISSILKGKKFRCNKRFEPGVPDRQSSSLSIKQLDHRGFAASEWFELIKSPINLTPANQYISPIISIYFVYASQRIQGRFEIFTPHFFYSNAYIVIMTSISLIICSFIILSMNPII